MADLAYDARVPVVARLVHLRWCTSQECRESPVGTSYGSEDAATAKVILAELDRMK